MSFCRLFTACLFYGVKFCEECRGWFLFEDFVEDERLCTRCDISRKMLEKQRKKHEPPVENPIDLTNEYKKKKKCPQG